MLRIRTFDEIRADKSFRKMLPWLLAIYVVFFGFVLLEGYNPGLINQLLEALFHKLK